MFARITGVPVILWALCLSGTCALHLGLEDLYGEALAVRSKLLRGGGFARFGLKGRGFGVRSTRVGVEGTGAVMAETEGDAFAVDVEGGDVESVVVDPEMAKVRAFMPKEMLLGDRRRKSIWDYSVIDLYGKTAWFYPEAPWGRKDVHRPCSSFLKVWHLVVWGAMTHVAVMAPFQAAGFQSLKDGFELKNTCDLGYVADRSIFVLLVDIIFACDIFVSLHTAYYQSKGQGRFILVDDLKNVRRQYLNSRYFFFDAMGIIPFRALACLATAVLSRINPRMAVPPTLMGFFQILRLLKLLRLQHFRRMWRFVTHRFPRKIRVLEIAKLLMMLTFTGHLLSCSWFYVGRINPFGWVAKKISPSAGWFEKYVTSFYFVYATMTTVGYGDISGFTMWEKIFCVWTMVVGSFLFGVLIGSVPKIIHKHQNALSRYCELEANVKEYLQEHKSPAEMRGRILQYYEYRYPHRRKFHLHRHLRELPRSIQEDLAVHVNKDIVTSNIFLSKSSASTVSDIALRLRDIFAARGDVIVAAGSAPDGIYFIRSGVVQVTRGNIACRYLKPGDCFGENCILDPDAYDHPTQTATVCAREPVEILKLYLHDFEDMVHEHEDFKLSNDDSWPKIRQYIIRRRNERIGKIAQNEVLDSVRNLIMQVKDLGKGQADLVAKATTRPQRSHLHPAQQSVDLGAEDASNFGNRTAVPSVPRRAHEAPQRAIRFQEVLDDNAYFESLVADPTHLCSVTPRRSKSFRSFRDSPPSRSHSRSTSVSQRRRLEALGASRPGTGTSIASPVGELKKEFVGIVPGLVEPERREAGYAQGGSKYDFTSGSSRVAGGKEDKDYKPGVIDMHRRDDNRRDWEDD